MLDYILFKIECIFIKRKINKLVKKFGMVNKNLINNMYPGYRIIIFDLENNFITKNSYLYCIERIV